MEHGRDTHRHEAERAARRRTDAPARALAGALIGAAALLAVQWPLPASAGRAILGTSGKDTLRGTSGDNRI